MLAEIFLIKVTHNSLYIKFKIFTDVLCLSILGSVEASALQSDFPLSKLNVALQFCDVVSCSKNHFHKSIKCWSKSEGNF